MIVKKVSHLIKSNKFYLTSCNSVYEVKFSADPNLTPQECHRLLQKYMQPHVTTSKVLQHLFIK